MCAQKKKEQQKQIVKQGFFFGMYMFWICVCDISGCGCWMYSVALHLIF